MISNRHINLIKDKLVIAFDYDPRVVALVGSFEGSKYYPKKRSWTIPSVHVIRVVELLLPFGFDYDLSTSRFYQEKKRQLVKIENAKRGIFSEKEEAIFSDTELPFRHYQKIGSAFECIAKNCILGDAPGLGKTLQSIGATRLKDAKKVLILCPSSAKITWKDECQKWVPDLTSVMITGSPAQRTKLWNSDSVYYIANYELLHRDVETMRNIDWDFVIADEATDISNPAAKTTKRIKKIKSKYRIALTGTPINNRVEDIWSIIDWANPGYLGTFSDFKKEYCNVDRFGNIESYKNLDKLRDKLAPFILRRLKSDVLDELPPKTYCDMKIEFSTKEREIYIRIEEEILGELKMLGMFNARNLEKSLVKLTRLRQVSNSLELVTGENHSSKLNALKNLLSIILADKNEKTIIFSVSRKMAMILHRELSEYNPLLIVGGLSDDEKEKNIHDFNNLNENRIMIMTSAGSRSLNLQRASSVIHYDLPWSISAATQREDRAHRMGQKSNVTIYRLLMEGSIDEKILEVLYSKRRLSEQVVGQSDDDLSEVTTMSDTEFQQLFTIYK